MRKFWKFLALGPIFFSVSVRAAPAPKLPNSVSCVYEAMSADQRLKVQRLFTDAAFNNIDPTRDPVTARQIEGTINDASVACIKLYRWGPKKFDNAKPFAMFRVMQETWDDNMSARNMPPADITAYFQANAAPAQHGTRATEAEHQALQAHLRSLGWRIDEPTVAEIVRSYFNLLHVLAFIERAFADKVVGSPP